MALPYVGEGAVFDVAWSSGSMKSTPPGADPPATAAAAASPAPTSAVPPWLTPQLLTAAFRDEDEACGQVTTIRVRPATGPNENYLSELFRVHAHLGKGEVRRLIVKAVPAGEAQLAMVEACGVFARETRMLKETLPHLERQLAAGLSHRPAEHLQLGPRVIATCSNDALLMEDLAVRGYSNVSRREGLDLPHSLLCVRLLARLHAASVVVHGRGGRWARDLEAYGGGWSGPGMRPVFERVYTTSLQTLATAARAWPRLGEQVAVRLERGVDALPQRALEAASLRDGDFAVLCHGDAWSNNIMFAYDEDTAQVRSALLVDFQLVTWASPAVDLHYFLALGAAPRVRQQHAARLVRAYHAELVASLGALGWLGAVPALAALQRDLRARQHWALFSSCLIPIRYVEASAVDMDAECMMTRDHPVRLRVLNDPACRAATEDALLEFVEKGLFD
ncbi:4-hydroxytryptamine kinase [Frankliniella fusca]|uniref:4-hydroxytryptamine kinase n=1 Tax=Frankliniella fusca TaxID=407009 RepID=A0AAE1H4P5_9NEOP|nr:4-hydroxytryptamine kinase [Frankliniella fusca]